MQEILEHKKKIAKKSEILRNPNIREHKEIVRQQLQDQKEKLNTFIDETSATLFSELYNDICADIALYETNRHPTYLSPSYVGPKKTGYLKITRD